MRKKFIIMLAGLVALAALSVGVVIGAPVGPLEDGAEPANQMSGINYEVSVTNLMPGQILSPVFMATHSSANEPLFVLGQPASAAVAAMAEDADASGLLEAYGDRNDEANDAQVVALDGGPIPPGMTATGIINIDGSATRLSLMAMLVSTNDGFIALRNMSLVGAVERSVTVPVYDSGSEANTEDCAYIPGPPCGNHVRDTTNASEGFVHIHNGVHGGGGLTPKQHDWHNPAALITIKRVF